MQRYDLTHWTEPHETELKNILFQPPKPTGIIVHCWGGWRWTTEDGEEYRTDSEGNGLWWYSPRQGWQQSKGTCQFGLSADRQKALRGLRRSNLMPRAI